MSSATVSASEVALFDSLATQWWDPNGPMRPLHRMNPTRIGWVHDRISRRFPSPAGVRVLDVGCGAGLASEALAQLGYDVLGVDAAEQVVAAARVHAEGQGLTLSYRVGVVEDLAAEGLRFPVINALEVIEHVPDPARFIGVLAQLLEPGGVLCLSTLNRTRRSFLVAKVGAEYLLRMLPVGTHEWAKFITPVELGGMLRRAGLRVTDSAGLLPELTGGWRIGKTMAVNYLMAAAK